MAEDVIQETEEGTEEGATEASKTDTGGKDADKGEESDGKAKAAEKVEAGADWRVGIADESLRKHAERFANLDDVLKANVESRQLLSRAIQPLRKNAKADDVAAYRKAMGVPETIDGYVFDVPKDMDAAVLQTDEAKASLKSLAEVAHAHHIPGEAFKGLVGEYFRQIAAKEQAAIAADKAHAEESLAKLKTEWGPNTPKEMAFANRGAEWVFGQDFEAFRGLKDAADRLIGDNPVMVKGLNKIGRAVSEDSIGVFPVDQEGIASARTELNKLTLEQFTAMQNGDHEKAKMLDLKIMEVSRKISGDSLIA